jgi:hypothetical protein
MNMLGTYLKQDADAALLVELDVHLIGRLSLCISHGLSLVLLKMFPWKVIQHLWLLRCLSPFLPLGLLGCIKNGLLAKPKPLPRHGTLRG